MRSLSGNHTLEEFKMDLYLAWRQPTCLALTLYFSLLSSCMAFHKEPQTCDFVLCGLASSGAFLAFAVTFLAFFFQTVSYVNFQTECQTHNCVALTELYCKILHTWVRVICSGLGPYHYLEQQFFTWFSTYTSYGCYLKVYIMLLAYLQIIQLQMWNVCIYCAVITMIHNPNHGCVNGKALPNINWSIQLGNDIP